LTHEYHLKLNYELILSMSDNIALLYDQLTTPKIVVPKVYSKIVLSNFVHKNLLEYQVDHVLKLIRKLLVSNIAIDASDTGIGKTYISAAICKELERRPIIICPKTLIYIWRQVLTIFKVKAYDIVNYETIRNGKNYVNSKCKTRKTCPYLKLVPHDPNILGQARYSWDVPNDAIVIFDEMHRCKDPTTENGKLLISTKQLAAKKIPLLLLSATISERFTDVKILFYLCGLIPSVRSFKQYVQTLETKHPKHIIKKSDYDNKQQYNIARDNAQSMMIYEEIKDYTSRIRIKDLGDKFPSNQICCQQFMADEANKIAVAYEEIAQHMLALKNEELDNHLAEIQKLKQEIEFRKVPIFIEQTLLYLEEGKSVVIFVKYLKTLHLLSKELGIVCQIYGGERGQNMEDRQRAIDLFQSDEQRIIICQIDAGGLGISLHDANGKYPRVSLMNFPDSASSLIQALGRIHRAGGKSPTLQRIIFVANVAYEKKIMQNLNKKLTNLSAINDGDLDSYKYAVKKITRKLIPKK